MNAARKIPAENLPARAWSMHADALAAWVEKNMVNRHDAYGGYYTKDGETRPTTRKAGDRDGPLTLSRLARHFKANGTDDVIGLHSIEVDEGGECWCRWISVDIDRHGAEGDAGVNFKVALAWHERAVSLGFSPLLYDSNGRGGFHLTLLLSGRVAARTAFAFARWLTRDREELGLDKVETFPKQPGIAPGKFGNWMRLPGRHHTKDHLTKVWKAKGWLEGVDAIRVILGTKGTNPDAIPAEGRPDVEAPFDLGRGIERERSRLGVVDLEGGHQRLASIEGVVEPGQDFNARATWESILTPHGWVLDHVSEETGFWRRPAKDSGQSATTNHNGNDTLYVFTNATGFIQDGSYSKFGAYTVLNHGGSTKEAFKEATNALSQQGHGVFAAWIWDARSSDWVEGLHPNPVPSGRGTTVRLRFPGKPKPAPLKNPVGVIRDGHHLSNGKAGGPSNSGSATAVVIDPGRFNLTDLGNAERLVFRHGADLRYCHPWKRWLVWDGRRWAPDNTGASRRRARNTVRAIYGEARDEEAEDRRKALVKWGTESEKRDRISAMLGLAEAEEGVPILPEMMDQDPWSFNCLNGTVDLRTGELRPHRQEDLITKLCPLNYRPDAPCGLWESTIGLFLAENQRLIDYFDLIIGYAMTGIVRDQIMPVAFGKGSNGKSTILGTLIDVWGPDYAMKCPPDMLMAKKTDSHPTDRADLFGKRLVVAIETEGGRRLNETMVKELTGRDKIRARRMREDFWEFAPTHKLILATNNKPIIRGTDQGIWRRLKLIPFAVRVEGDRDDKTMPEKLRAEHEGILARCVRGCLRWQAEGLKEPAEVTEASEDYRKEQDVFGAFLEEHCIVDHPNQKVKAGDLFARYKAWCESSKESVMTNTAFGIRMKDRGYEKKKSGDWWYIGIALKPKDDDAGNEPAF